MKLKRSEYLQVVGLLALASRHGQEMNDIEEAICKIVGEKPFTGSHVGDAIYARPVYSADDLLSRLSAQRKREAKK